MAADLDPDLGPDHGGAGPGRATVADLYGDYIAAGFPAADFWALTPRLYLLQIQAAARRQRRADHDAITQAWLQARLIRSQNLPRLEELTRSFAPPRRRDPRDMAADLAALSNSLPKETWKGWQKRMLGISGRALG